MILKGFDEFREKLPILKGIRIIFLPIYVFLVIILTFYGLTLFYSYPQNFSYQNSSMFLLLIPFFGVVLVELTGFFLVSQLWIWRDKLKQRYGSLSYQRIFFVGLCGITIIIFLAFNNFISFLSYSPSFWQINENSFLIRPFNSLFGDQLNNIIYGFQIVLGLLFLLLGVSMSMRSVHTFGIDYTTVVYLYFPEEGSVQKNQIYSVLRHPMYCGLIFVSFGGFLYNLTLYSFIFFLIYIIGFYIHIHFVEEPELISRFGESYKSYRKSVPAFFINPFKLPVLLRFILKG